jgi:hypothetical protein
MAVKRATVKKATAKKAPAKRTAGRGKTNPGDKLVCGVCGISLTVDEACGCAEAHPIFCCEQPMKKKRARK